MRRRSRGGQGTLEYILVMSVIMLAILAASTGIKDAVQGKSGKGVFQGAQKAITDASTEWKTKQGF